MLPAILVVSRLSKAKRSGKFLPSGLIYGNACSKCGEEVVVSPTSSPLIPLGVPLVCEECREKIPAVEQSLEVTMPGIEQEHAKWAAERDRN